MFGEEGAAEVDPADINGGDRLSRRKCCGGEQTQDTEGGGVMAETSMCNSCGGGRGDTNLCVMWQW